MQGIGTLTVYGDFEVVAQGRGALTAKVFFRTAATLSGAGVMHGLANGSGFGYGVSVLPSLGGRGGIDDPGHGDGTAYLPALFADGTGGVFIPTATSGAASILPRIGGSGLLLVSRSGGGEATLSALTSRGGPKGYGHGEATLRSISSYGVYGLSNHEAHVISYLGAGDPTTAINRVLSVVFISDGEVTSVQTSTVLQAIEFISSLTQSGDMSALGTFTQSLIDAMGVFSRGAQNVVDGDSVVAPDFGTDGIVWVVNVETGQSSQYDGYTFNSFFEREGEYFGVANDGIYQLDGVDDVGTDIESLIDFGESDCGLPGRKKILNVHIGTSDGSDMYLKVDTDTGTQTYKLVASVRGATDYRAKLIHNLQGMYWNFTLTAVNDFELSGVDFRPANLSRRL